MKKNHVWIVEHHEYFSRSWVPHNLKRTWYWSEDEAKLKNKELWKEQTTRLRKYVAVLAMLAAMLCVQGCKSSGNVNASDPVERGLSYVACAIVTSAVIRALFNR